MLRAIPCIFLLTLVGCPADPPPPTPARASAPPSPRAPAAAADLPPGQWPNEARVEVVDGVWFVLRNGEQAHSKHRDTFALPPLAQRRSLKPGQLCKLLFEIHTPHETQVERMWVQVKAVSHDGRYTGSLDNDPRVTDQLRSGFEVAFAPRHVIQIEPLETND